MKKIALCVSGTFTLAIIYALYGILGPVNTTDTNDSGTAIPPTGGGNDVQISNRPISDPNSYLSITLPKNIIADISINVINNGDADGQPNYIVMSQYYMTMWDDGLPEVKSHNDVLTKVQIIRDKILKFKSQNIFSRYPMGTVLTGDTIFVEIDGKAVSLGELIRFGFYFNSGKTTPYDEYYCKIGMRNYGIKIEVRNKGFMKYFDSSH
ncbi:hypothetical protein L6Q79_09190 [bacterium]|nr:hypothetical protein [bacterium]NUN45182.1 hypothetical protein [bacterium]